MKIKVSEATNMQLNWLVATAEGYEVAVASSGSVVILRNNVTDYFDPATNAGWSWPIIDREGISVGDPAHFDDYGSSETHFAVKGFPGDYADEVCPIGRGPTSLIAAMRCYVASKLGNEVEVPEELK